MSGVDIRFFMTARAVAAHTDEHPLGVTVLAREFGVFALADKDCRVVEVPHSIRAIVADETFAAKTVAVAADEQSIVLGMTFVAVHSRG